MEGKEIAIPGIIATPKSAAMIDEHTQYRYFCADIADGIDLVFKESPRWPQVYIDVADINDNSPFFLPDTRTIQLSELSSTGTAVLLPASHDADTTANSVTSYHLNAAAELDEDSGIVDRSATELFSLTMSTKLDGSTDVKLVLVRELDREWSDTHRLVVTAFDGGQPRRSGTLNIIVKVLDANDNRLAAAYDNFVEHEQSQSL